MFRVEMLPAGHGDCLWIEYGSEESPFRLLIDGGTAGTYSRLKRRMDQVLDEILSFELLVVTHIDGDHIAGVLKLLEDETSDFNIDDIWFNGYHHLPESGLDILGIEQAESLTEHIRDKNLAWNKLFSNNAVALNETNVLPEKTLPGGMKLTVLSPSVDKLGKLKPKWREFVIAAGLDPNNPHEEEEDLDTRPSGLEPLGVFQLPDVDALADTPFEEDPSEANGTSIVLLAEYNGHSILLCGDGHADIINTSLEKLANRRGIDVFPLDAIKLPHHGSKVNVSTDLLKKIDCHHYLVSSNGAYYQHPDEIAIARIIKYGGPNPRIYFNYHSKFNKIWSNPTLRNDYGYSVDYPMNTDDSLVLNLE